MNTTAIYRRPEWIVLSTVVLAAAIGGALRTFSTQTAPLPEATSEQAEQAADGTETPALFESPIVSLSDQLQAAASPADLLLSTSSLERLSTVSAGRLDPFAPVTQATGRPRPSQSAEPAPVTPTSSTSTTRPAESLPPVPTINTGGLPAVPVASAPPQAAPLPSIPIATNPLPIPSLPSSLPGFPQAAPVPQDPLQAIELTGVVQVGDRVGIIVREGSGKTSRHIFVGDSLAGGQVKVKSIDLSAQEPVIILEYQGQEYPRVVG